MTRHTPLRRFSPKTRKPKASTGRRDLEDMTHGELEKLLDSEVSIHVRASGAEDSSGFVPCFTCGSYHHFKELDAGHYIGRSNRGVRWDLRNIRPQCTRCNVYEEGRHYKFRANLVVELGEAEVLDLEQTADLYGASKMPREWLINQIKAWRAKNAPLRKELKCL